MKRNCFSLQFWFSPLRWIYAIFLLTNTVLAQTPNIEGVYNLISRNLEDGKVQHQPDIKGLMIFSKGYCTVYIISKDAEGKTKSYARAYNYSISSTQFTATNISSHSHDGKDIVYELSGDTKTSPVTVKNGNIQYKSPLDEPVLIFERNKLTATLSDHVDTWEKVE